MRTREPRRALQAARRAIELDPSHANAHHMMGHALVALDRVEPAIRELETAVSLDPQLGGAWCALVDVLDQHVDRARALERARAALKTLPRNDSKARVWLEGRERVRTEEAVRR